MFLDPEGGVDWRRLLGRVLMLGIWFTVTTTILQLTWTAFVHVHPDWASWRTPRVWLASATAVAYCIGKVGVCYFAKRKACRQATS